MQFFQLVLCCLLCSLSFTVLAHQEDELVISEIEEGQLDFQDEQLTEEYKAALKRQRMRRLSAMSWQKKFRLFLKAGIEHIIPKGLDHILFVLGLFFSTLFFRKLLWQITAFTLAHTITLGLTGLGIIQLPSSFIEPLIALSIVWVAVENCLFTQPKAWRPVVVFGFGLLHGLGFASVLNANGLPEGNLLPTLLAFNIGVEVGQLLVILAAFLLVFFVRRKKWYRQRIQLPASIAIAAVGLFWFIQRIL